MHSLKQGVLFISFFLNNHFRQAIYSFRCFCRHPNLNFLPRGTAVSFVEVDLSSFILPETLNEFQPMFQRRKRKRGIEQKRKLKIENEEDARIEARKSVIYNLRVFNEATMLTLCV